MEAVAAAESAITESTLCKLTAATSDESAPGRSPTGPDAGLSTGEIASAEAPAPAHAGLSTGEVAAAEAAAAAHARLATGPIAAAEASAACSTAAHMHAASGRTAARSHAASAGRAAANVRRSAATASVHTATPHLTEGRSCNNQAERQGCRAQNTEFRHRASPIKIWSKTSALPHGSGIFELFELLRLPHLRVCPSAEWNQFNNGVLILSGSKAQALCPPVSVI